MARETREVRFEFTGDISDIFQGDIAGSFKQWFFAIGVHFVSHINGVF